MNKDKSKSQKYMTVGVVADKMDVTVRTLQYYDREGLLSPSAESEGGRRLYTDKDLVKLHQILSLKSLGFSLNDIKNRLVSLDTPGDVANALTQQAEAIRQKMESLAKSLNSIEALRAEVLQMKSVDFKKYADIIVNLKMKNEFYWLIKHFDDKTLDHIRARFDKESGIAMIKKFNRLYDEAVKLKNDGVLPGGEEGQCFAKVYWDMIMEFTNGDMSLLPKLMEFSENMDNENEYWKEKQATANAFIEPALEAYFDSFGYNPFKEEQK